MSRFTRCSLVNQTMRNSTTFHQMSLMQESQILDSERQFGQVHLNPPASRQAK
jgi:hypothetical protein